MERGHIACADAIPKCCHNHNVFTVPKSSGWAISVGDCSKLQELSVNNFVDQVCKTFSYKGVDDLVDELITDDFIAVIDIKDV